MNKEKLKSLSFEKLLQLKECVNEIVLRTHITGNPTPRWQKFNDLLLEINKIIENTVYHEYFD